MEQVESRTAVAERRLVAEQKCSTMPTAYYRHAVYGMSDSNVLPKSRQWLVERLIQEGFDAHQAILSARQMVLYVNEGELQKKLQTPWL